MRMLLNEGWQIFYRNPQANQDAAELVPDQSAGEWLDTEVPGDVHSTLLKYEKIADPFYSTNIEQCRWVETAVWWYRKEFSWDRELHPGEVVELQFNGLDTFATVFLNGEPVGTHQNMFTPSVFTITTALHPGINQLAVRFDSTMAVTSQKDYGRMWYSYNPNRAWVRKAQMNFSWDWGPRLITVGIWKGVELNIRQKARIETVAVRTETITANQARLGIEIETRSYGKELRLQARVKLGEGAGAVTRTIDLGPGKTTVNLTVDNPRLWWTHDLGEPYRYDLRVTLKDGTDILDQYSAKIGIRSLELRQQAAGGEKRFTFVVNGVEIFAKGANWIPAHNLLGTIREDTYRRWLELAKQGNMNMLRVWGGGIYEQEAFYDECDRLGILVWQDFMFACSSYPDFDAEFMANVREEIRYVVKTLRNHPSLALWCGNNENQWIHGQKMSTLEDLRFYGEKIYHDLMPELLADLDPTRPYWPGSPFGGNDPNSDAEGDKHNWQVWAGQIYPHKHGEPQRLDNTPAGVSFKHYAEDQGKFISEFGMHAAPVLATLQSCIPREQLCLGSFELRYRNKDKRPNRGIMLMQSYTGLPGDLKEYIDFSMLTQGEGLKFGIEHYRRRKPDCSGTLIWQLNDCWPALSWSLADFYLRPKAGYYYTRRAYQPVLLSWKEDGPATVSLWATNDTQAEYRDILEVGLENFIGNREYREEIVVAVPAGASVRIKEFSKNRINVNYTNFEFLYVIPQAPGVNSNIFFFDDYKDLNLPPCQLSTELKKIGEGNLEVAITTDCFAKFIKLEGYPDGAILNDNYFDLMPGECKRLLIKGVSAVPEQITVTAINQQR